MGEAKSPLTGRLKAALAFFAVAAIVELGDLAGLLVTWGNPEPAAQMLGIAVNMQRVRVIILGLLAAQIVLGSLTAVGGLVRRRWLNFRMGALVAAVALLLYGGFQIITGAFQMGNLIIAIIGVVYAALGWLGFWFSRSPVSAASTTAEQAR